MEKGRGMRVEKGERGGESGELWELRVWKKRGWDGRRRRKGGREWG